MSKRKKISHKRHPRGRKQTFSISVPRLRLLAGITIIVTAVFLAYLPSISGEFVMDDETLVTKNEQIQASDGLYQFWFTTRACDYWPMTNSSFWIEWRLWYTNPTGYHVTNLILHIIESLLIWLILWKLSIPGAFLAAVIFALHPVNVQSVAWIAQRKNTMAMLFFLLSILCYLKFEIAPSFTQDHRYRTISPLAPGHHVSGRSPLWYWLSLAAFLLAMLSKGSVAVLPVLLLGIVWWLRPLTKLDLLRTVPFFLIAAVLTVVNIWFRTHGAETVFLTPSFMQRLLGAGSVVWFYLYKALLPINLVFIYPQWHIDPGNPLWWMPLAAALVVTGVLWQYRESWSRPLLFVWGFFCVALLPVMGFIDVGFMKHSLVADHYQHIAIIGVIALASALWSAWYQPMRGAARWSAAFVAVMAVAALTFLTWQQSGLYRERLTLYQTTLKKNPECWLAHGNLGVELAQKGRLGEAIEHFQQALLLKPDYYEAHNNLGNALSDMGRLSESIEQFEEALRLNPNYPDALFNLGNSMNKVGRLQEAIERYHQAVTLKPNFPDALFNLANLLATTGRLQEAIERYQQALRLKPDHIKAHNNLGLALMLTGQPQKAIEHFQQVLRLEPDSINAHINLASAYGGINQSAEAVALTQKALQLARSTGQTALAKQIEDSLNSYRAGLSGPSTTLPTSDSASPPPSKSSPPSP